MYRNASWRCRAGGLLAVGLIAFLFGVAVADARERNRTLKLYFTHTGERGEFTFKRNGKYDTAVLKELNQFLRDWRRDEPTKMDPRLFDIIWEVYREVRATSEINVVSGYRSLKTNDMLRRRGRGAAKQSRHTRGQALDFFIPGVSVSKIRRAGLRLQQGGVGYYPKSGSPFVHLDTGNVRHWPRMTRQQLASVFPKGQTLHVPTDGKPLAGYEIAKAKFGRRSSEANVAYLNPTTRAIQAEPVKTAGNKATLSNWLKRTLGGGADEEEDNLDQPSEILVAKADTPPAPLPRELSTSARQIALAALSDQPEPENAAPVSVALAFADGRTQSAASLSDRLTPTLPASRSQDQIKLSRLMAQAVIRARSDELASSADSNPAPPIAEFTVAAGPAPVPQPEQESTVEFVAGTADDPGGTAIEAAKAISVSGEGRSTITLETERTVALAYAAIGTGELAGPRQRPIPNAQIKPRNRTEPADLQNVEIDPLPAGNDDIIDWDQPVRPVVAEAGVAEVVVTESEAAEFMRFLRGETTRTRVFAALEMPHPWAVPGLFNAPKNVFAAARYHSGRELRFDRFALIEIKPKKPAETSQLASVQRRAPSRY